MEMTHDIEKFVSQRYNQGDSDWISSEKAPGHREFYWKLRISFVIETSKERDDIAIQFFTYLLRNKIEHKFPPSNPPAEIVIYPYTLSQAIKIIQEFVPYMAKYPHYFLDPFLYERKLTRGLGTRYEAAILDVKGFEHEAEKILAKTLPIAAELFRLYGNHNPYAPVSQQKCAELEKKVGENDKEKVLLALHKRGNQRMREELRKRMVYHGDEVLPKLLEVIFKAPLYILLTYYRSSKGNINSVVYKMLYVQQPSRGYEENYRKFEAMAASRDPAYRLLADTAKKAFN